MHSVGSHKKDNISPLSSEFYDKSGEPDKNRDNKRQHIKSGDSRLDQEGWNVRKPLFLFGPWKISGLSQNYRCGPLGQIKVTVCKIIKF